MRAAFRRGAAGTHRGPGAGDCRGSSVRPELGGSQTSETDTELDKLPGTLGGSAPQHRKYLYGNRSSNEIRVRGGWSALLPSSPQTTTLWPLWPTSYQNLPLGATLSGCREIPDLNHPLPLPLSPPPASS